VIIYHILGAVRFFAGPRFFMKREETVSFGSSWQWASSGGPAMSFSLQTPILMPVRVGFAVAMMMWLICGCTSREATILDSLRGSRNLPDAGASLSGNGDLEAWLVDARTVAGYNEAFAFRSGDYFLTVEAFQQGIEPGDTVPTEGYVVRQSVSDGFLITSESSDYGVSFRPWFQLPVERVLPARSYEGFWFDGVQSGWYFVFRDSNFTVIPPRPAELSLTRVEGGNVDRVASVDWVDQRVERLQITPGGVAWVLLRPRDERAQLIWSVAYSGDEGQSWSEPFALPAEGALAPRMAVNERSVILAVPTQSQAWTFDRRSQEWGQVTFDGAQQVAVGAAGDDVLFAAPQVGQDAYGTVAECWRREGEGQTWEKVSEQRIYADALRFLPTNPNLGLAFSQDVLQLTRDRGQTWELLAFPL